MEQACIYTLRELSGRSSEYVKDLIQHYKKALTDLKEKEQRGFSIHGRYSGRPFSESYRKLLKSDRRFREKAIKELEEKLPWVIAEEKKRERKRRQEEEESLKVNLQIDTILSKGGKEIEAELLRLWPYATPLARRLVFLHLLPSKEQADEKRGYNSQKGNVYRLKLKEKEVVEDDTA